jgi:hypothetical protein
VVPWRRESVEEEEEGKALLADTIEESAVYTH